MWNDHLGGGGTVLTVVTVFSLFVFWGCSLSSVVGTACMDAAIVAHRVLFICLGCAYTCNAWCIGVVLVMILSILYSIACFMLFCCFYLHRTVRSVLFGAVVGVVVVLSGGRLHAAGVCVDRAIFCGYDSFGG